MLAFVFCQECAGGSSAFRGLQGRASSPASRGVRGSQSTAATRLSLHRSPRITARPASSAACRWRGYTPGTGHGSLPGHLQRNVVAAFQGARDRSRRIRERLLPALHVFHDRLTPFGPPARADLVVDGVGRQDRLEPIPLGAVVPLHYGASRPYGTDRARATSLISRLWPPSNAAQKGAPEPGYLGSSLSGSMSSFKNGPEAGGSGKPARVWPFCSSKFVYLWTSPGLSSAA